MCLEAIFMNKSEIFNDVNQAEADKLYFLKIEDRVNLKVFHTTWMIIFFGVCAITIGAMGIAFFKVDFKLGAVLVVSTHVLCILAIKKTSCLMFFSMPFYF